MTGFEALEHRGAISVLAYICDNPGCMVTDMFRVLETPGVSAIWDRMMRLEAAGLVVRDTERRDRYGTKPLTATPKGQRIIEVLREVEEWRA